MFHLFHHGLLGIMGGIGLILLLIAIWVFIGTIVVGFTFSTIADRRHDTIQNPKGIPILNPEAELMDAPMTFFSTILWPIVVLILIGWGIVTIMKLTVGSDWVRMKVANFFLKRAYLRELKRNGDGW